MRRSTWLNQVVESDITWSYDHDFLWFFSNAFIWGQMKGFSCSILSLHLYVLDMHAKQKKFLKCITSNDLRFIKFIQIKWTIFKVWPTFCFIETQALFINIFFVQCLQICITFQTYLLTVVSIILITIIIWKKGTNDWNNKYIPKHQSCTKMAWTNSSFHLPICELNVATCTP